MSNEKQEVKKMIQSLNKIRVEMSVHKNFLDYTNDQKKIFGSDPSV